jgi:heterodisulfide reductase subunit A-like polyferredoxin
MIQVHHGLCCYCGMCVATCPYARLELDDATLTIHAGCRQCGICVEICPIGALEVRHEDI